MPIVPNFVERQLFFTLNMGPAPMLDIFNMLNFRVVLGAIRCDVFESLAQQPATAAQLAQRLNLNPAATTQLLTALAHLGYVQEHNGQYTPTKMSKKWLTGQASNLSTYYKYWGAIWERLWANFEDTLRTGSNPTNLYEWIENEPAISSDFQEAMIVLAQLGLDETAKKLPMPATARRLLDIGGGHAMYSVALCQKYPELTATVWDMPTPLLTGRANVASANLKDRIAFREGNFMEDAPETDYDVALLFNILHGFDEAGNRTLFERMRPALKQGGLLVIADQLTDGVPSPTMNAAVHLLGMAYLHLLGGKIYSFAEVKGLLEATGYTNVRRVNLLKSGSALILAERA